MVKWYTGRPSGLGRGVSGPVVGRTTPSAARGSISHPRSWRTGATTVTIDAAGRLVIPKTLRDAAGLRPGMPLQARLRDGRIEIEPAPTAVSLVMKDGIGVARSAGAPGEDEPVLLASEVETVRARLRDERGQ
ncbi:MAG: AbrB/MazE/SpoVT family DNA-binding domain-containing protein [Trueperaceae bacterium]|nr:AbrB/MazE/SpoVT family DNA-binding domain-containing protein [Trueperaceae bacterium]